LGTVWHGFAELALLSFRLLIKNLGF
jgi:hypothetical protein